MKWPNTLTVVRHAESAYNELKIRKESDPLYKEFKTAYNARKRDPERARELARQVLASEHLVLKCGDHDTPITDRGHRQSVATGKGLRERIPLPDTIFVSPYDRPKQTLGSMAIGWPELAGVKTVQEERIREQEHGLALLYNDWRIYNVMHPEQEQLRDREGSFWYRYPQGENVPDVRERNRSFVSTLVRDYAEQNILVVTHHLNILSLRANLERLDVAAFLDLDQNEKPINCGATKYQGYPDLGADGKLLLETYNERFY